jgi:hypothetical protein
MRRSGPLVVDGILAGAAEATISTLKNELATA